MIRARRLGLKALDGLQYAVAVNGLLVVVVGALSLLATGDLVALKWVLFLVGVALIGVASVKLRPPPAWRDEHRLGITNSYTEEGFGARVGELPPLAWYDPAREDHLSDGARLFYAGVAAWVVSFTMEAVFDVGVPQVG